MAFNVKDETALAELREIADLTKSSMSTELRVAVHARLLQVRSERENKLERLREISRRSAQLWKGAADPATDLYDDAGLPK